MKVEYLPEEQGQSLVEYSLLILLIAIAAIVALVALGQTVLTELWQPIQDFILPILGMA